MYRCLVQLRQKIKEFFLSLGLSPLPEQDTSELYEMIYHNERIPNLMSMNPNFKENDKKTLLMAIKGRNKLCHGNVFVIYREWHSLLLAWIDVAMRIGADSLATEIGKTLNLLLTPLIIKLMTPLWTPFYVGRFFLVALYVLFLFYYSLLLGWLLIVFLLFVFFSHIV